MLATANAGSIRAAISRIFIVNLLVFIFSVIFLVIVIFIVIVVVKILIVIIVFVKFVRRVVDENVIVVAVG